MRLELVCFVSFGLALCCVVIVLFWFWLQLPIVPDDPYGPETFREVKITAAIIDDWYNRYSVEVTLLRSISVWVGLLLRFCVFVLNAEHRKACVSGYEWQTKEDPI